VRLGQSGAVLQGCQNENGYKQLFKNTLTYPTRPARGAGIGIDKSGSIMYHSALGQIVVIEDDPRNSRYDRPWSEW
jgi:hypothetical protein